MTDPACPAAVALKVSCCYLFTHTFTDKYTRWSSSGRSVLCYAVRFSPSGRYLSSLHPFFFSFILLSLCLYNPSGTAAHVMPTASCTSSAGVKRVSTGSSEQEDLALVFFSGCTNWHAEWIHWHWYRCTVWIFFFFFFLFLFLFFTFNCR